MDTEKKISVIDQINSEKKISPKVRLQIQRAFDSCKWVTTLIPNSAWLKEGISNVGAIWADPRQFHLKVTQAYRATRADWSTHASHVHALDIILNWVDIRLWIYEDATGIESASSPKLTLEQSPIKQKTH